EDPEYRVRALCVVARDAVRATRLLDLAAEVIAKVPHERSELWACVATVAFAVGDLGRVVTCLDNVDEALPIMDMRGQRGRSLVGVLATLVAEVGADAHPAVVGRIRRLTEAVVGTDHWFDGLRVVVEAWGPVPWLEQLVLGLWDPSGQSELLVMLARKS